MSQPTEALPDYDQQLSGFHAAFAPELQSIIDRLPLRPEMRVLDLACGDGFYTERIAQKLGAQGAIVGSDVNPAYLAQARRRTEAGRVAAEFEFVSASFDRLPFADRSFDFVWCAQSLYTLPEPVTVLRHAARVLRPGGIVAVLENDSLHQVFLPWPVHLELPLRAAELRAFTESSRSASKYYVGRRLPAVIASAGLEPLGMTTHAFDRQAPLTDVERRLLQSYLDDVTDRVAPYLNRPLLDELRQLVAPESPRYLLGQSHLSMSWLNVLALGRKSSAAPPDRIGDDVGLPRGPG